MVASKPAEDFSVISGFEREDAFEQFIYSDDLQTDKQKKQTMINKYTWKQVKLKPNLLRF